MPDRCTFNDPEVHKRTLNKWEIGRRFELIAMIGRALSLLIRNCALWIRVGMHGMLIVAKYDSIRQIFAPICGKA